MNVLKKIKSVCAQVRDAIHSINNSLPLMNDSVNQLSTQMQKINQALSALTPASHALALSSPEQSITLTNNIFPSQYRAVYRNGDTPAFSSVAQPYTKANIDQTIEHLMQIVPKACSLWRECQAEGHKTYLADPMHNLSVAGHPLAEMFKNFVKPYLYGHVLDIGCGTQDVPYYLSEHPLQYLAGIDPLAPTGKHPFAFSQALAEDIPWADDSFDRVTVATSLDHMIILDKVFMEVTRVLKPGGLFIAWLGFLPHAEPYDPYSPTLKRIDPCHIFHFDRPCFENAIRDYFHVNYSYEVFYEQQQAIYDCFYVLSPKHK